jgi:hypothetical protein
MTSADTASTIKRLKRAGFSSLEGEEMGVGEKVDDDAGFRVQGLGVRSVGVILATAHRGAPGADASVAESLRVMPYA